MDPRSQRTQIQIRDAFMALLIEEGFSQITVSALVKRAEINRATFYRHYADIHDLSHRFTDILFADINEQLAAAIGESADGGETPKAARCADELGEWVLLFEHVAQYAEFYRAMLRPGGIPGFRARVEATVAAQMQELLPKLGFAPAHEQMPAILAVRYLAAAQVGFMQWWLENDMPFPPHEAAAHLFNLHWRGGSWALGLALRIEPGLAVDRIGSRL